MRIENKLLEFYLNVKELEKDLARDAKRPYASPKLRSNAQTLYYKRIQNMKKRRAGVTKVGIFRREASLNHYTSEKLKNINHHIQLANAALRNWWAASKRS